MPGIIIFLDSLIVHYFISISNLLKCFLFNKVFHNYTFKNYSLSLHLCIPITIHCFIFPYHLASSNIIHILLYHLIIKSFPPTWTSAPFREGYLVLFKAAFPKTQEYLAQSRYLINIYKMNEKLYWWRESFERILESS